MPAPKVVVIWVIAAEASSPGTAALGAAAREALGARTEVRVTLAPSPGNTSDADPNTGLVRVTWDPKEHRRAHVACYLPELRRWVEQDVAFTAADPESERGRTLGFLIASTLMGASPPSPSPTPTPTQTPTREFGEVVPTATHPAADPVDPRPMAQRAARKACAPAQALRRPVRAGALGRHGRAVARTLHRLPAMDRAAEVRGDGYTMIRPALERKLAMDAFAALPEGHPMVALLELDVTEALAVIEKLRQQGARVSLFSFLVHAIALAISEHPDLNLVMHGRRMVRFDDVDISVPIEIETPDGKFPRDVVIRRAQLKTATQIYSELDAARRAQSATGYLGSEDRWVLRLARVLNWIPRFVRIALIRRMVSNAFLVKKRAGTTLVTSVGKFADIPGFAFTFSTGPRAAAFAIGSTASKPWVHEGRVVIRSIQSLAIMINHDLIDGAPAARFARRLQQIVESAEEFIVPD